MKFSTIFEQYVRKKIQYCKNYQKIPLNDFNVALAHSARSSYLRLQRVLFFFYSKIIKNVFWRISVSEWKLISVWIIISNTSALNHNWPKTELAIQISMLMQCMKPMKPIMKAPAFLTQASAYFTFSSVFKYHRFILVRIQELRWDSNEMWFNRKHVKVSDMSVTQFLLFQHTYQW